MPEKSRVPGVQVKSRPDVKRGGGKDGAGYSIAEEKVRATAAR